MEKRYYRGHYCGENVLVVERSGRGGLRRRSVQSGDFQGLEVSVREIAVWYLSSGRCQSGNCPVGKLSYNLTGKYSQQNSVTWAVWRNYSVFVYELSGWGFVSRCSHLNFRYCSASSQKLLDIQATIECGFTLKSVREMIRTYSLKHHTEKYSQDSSVIWQA